MKTLNTKSLHSLFDANIPLMPLRRVNKNASLNQIFGFSGHDEDIARKELFNSPRPF
jgi:hypothetical protein